MEIKVHDRDQLPDNSQLKPALFGHDGEDEKINNVGYISGMYVPVTYQVCMYKLHIRYTHTSYISGIHIPVTGIRIHYRCRRC